MASENKKALVFSILEFLQKSCQDGTISPDDTEGIEGMSWRASIDHGINACRQWPCNALVKPLVST